MHKYLLFRFSGCTRPLAALSSAVNVCECCEILVEQVDHAGELQHQWVRTSELDLSYKNTLIPKCCYKNVSKGIFTCFADLQFQNPFQEKLFCSRSGCEVCWTSFLEPAAGDDGPNSVILPPLCFTAGMLSCECRRPRLRSWLSRNKKPWVNVYSANSCCWEELQQCSWV